MRFLTLSIRSKLSLILALLSAPLALLGWYWAQAAITEIQSVERARGALERIAPVWREVVRQARHGLDEAWDAPPQETARALTAIIGDDSTAEGALELLLDADKPRRQRLDAGRFLIGHIAARDGLDMQRDPEAAFLAMVLDELLPDLTARAQSAAGAAAALDELGAAPASGRPFVSSALLEGLGGYEFLSQRLSEDGTRGLRLLPQQTISVVAGPLNAYFKSSLDFRAAARAIATVGAPPTPEALARLTETYSALTEAADLLWRAGLARMDGRLGELHQAAITAIAVSAGSLFAVLLAAFIWSRALSSSILRRIGKLETRINMLADSDVEGAIPERAGGDEVAKIANAVETLRTRIVRRMCEMRELEDARDLADAANQAKSEFLANMSHELRTPLNAIIGFSELMMLEAFGKMENERYSGYVKDIHDSAKHLLDLVNDVLDIAKIDARSCDFEFCALDSRDVLEDALTMLRPLVAKANLTAKIEIAPDAPRVCGDARSVHQIVLNLLSNAIKFTPEGGTVTLIARPAPLPTAPRGGVMLSVRDTGPGISKEDLAKLGSPFQRLGGPHVAKKEGAGLGLAISRSLSQAMGGALQFESELGRGTTASTLLPAYAAGMESGPPFAEEADSAAA